jgi:hypothetical protein
VHVSRRIKLLEEACVKKKKKKKKGEAQAFCFGPEGGVRARVFFFF